MKTRTVLALCAICIAAPSRGEGGGRAQGREEAIRDSITELRRECREAAGGDWRRWFESLAPFRAGLAARVDAARPFNPEAKGSFEARGAVLEMTGEPALFEPTPASAISYLYAVQDIDGWTRSRPAVPAVVAVSRWLAARNVDLLLVPAPRMTEVYADRVGLAVPASGFVAPHVRKLLLDLLEGDVEVVDLLPLFLKARAASAEPLYRPDDPHWGQRGWLISAAEVAARLGRYGFAVEARNRPPVLEVSRTPVRRTGAAYEALDPEQRKRVERFLTVDTIEVRPGKEPVVSPASPVVVIGDSFNDGFFPLLARELNMPVNILASSAQTTGAIKDLLRDPSLLANAKVVVWVTNSTSLAHESWNLPPLPTPTPAAPPTRSRTRP